MKRTISLQLALVIALVLSAIVGGICSKVAHDYGAERGLEAGRHTAQRKASIEYARRGAAYTFNRNHAADLLLAHPAVKALGALDEETQTAMVEILNRSTTPCYGLSRRGVSLATSLLDTDGPQACAAAGDQVVLAHLAWKTFHDVNEAVAVLWVERRSVVPYTDDEIVGPKDKPVTIIEFGDYQCPSCRRFHKVLKHITKERDDVRLVYKHFPLDFHHAAMPAALAVEAAALQGKRAEMHEAMFAVKRSFMKENYKKGWTMPAKGKVPFELEAKSVGVDLEKYRKDIRSDAVKQQVLDDMKLTKKLGVSATPTVWINNRRVIEPKIPTFMNRLIDKAKEEQAGTFTWDFQIPNTPKEKVPGPAKVPSPKEGAEAAAKAATQKTNQK